MKIGILIPSTTKGLNCKNYTDTYFYKIFLKSFIKTYHNKYKYTIYLVIDDDDKIYSQKNEIEKIKTFISLLSNIDIKFISSSGIEKGWVTKMWNRAFKQAYDDGCDYFYQCGDDIEFLDENWANACVDIMKYHNDSGVTGPIDWGRELFNKENGGNSKFLLTQTFVSRKHMEIFGFYFPPEIKNWFCDDWITYVYASKGKCYRMERRIYNKGGAPRYNPEGKGDDMLRMTKICQELINKYNKNIK